MYLTEQNLFVNSILIKSIQISVLLGDSELPYKISVLSACSSPSKISLLQESLDLKGPPEKNVYIHLMIANHHQVNGDSVEALKYAKNAFEQANEFDDLAMQADATR